MSTRAPKPRGNPRLALPLLLAAALAGVPSLAASPQSKMSDAEAVELGRRGMNLVMDGDPEGAIKIFHEIQQRAPQSPIGYVLEADATWWRIYYATGNLIDPDVFDVTNTITTPYDSHLEDMVRVAIAKSEAQIRAHESVARSYLYQGLAYAVRARLAGLRGKDFPAARAGKKMRSLMLTALRLDPGLTDACLGTGIYNYYVDTLPGIVKFLSIFIALPGGSRELGLQQLGRAATQGELARGEAQFYLAKNYSRQTERQYAKSLEVFEQLAREYPHNPLWRFLIGSLECRLGRTQVCDSIYRETFRKTAGEKAEVQQALHRAAQQALQRMHPEEKFGE